MRSWQRARRQRRCGAGAGPDPPRAGAPDGAGIDRDGATGWAIGRGGAMGSDMGRGGATGWAIGRSGDAG
jgi:hypothetical protein